MEWLKTFLFKEPLGSKSLLSLNGLTAIGGVGSLDFMSPILAVADLKDAFGKGLGIIMMIAFIFGLIKVISGAVAISNGNPEGKSAILYGIMVAGAPTIMFFIFRIFGLGRGGSDT